MGSKTGRNLPKVTPSQWQSWVRTQSLVAQCHTTTPWRDSPKGCSGVLGGSGEQVPVEAMKTRLSPLPRLRFKTIEKLKGWPLRKVSCWPENLSV